MFFTPDKISSICNAPIENIELVWPLVYNELEANGLAGYFSEIAAIAAILVNSPSFLPIHETGTDQEFERKYQGALDFNNIIPGDGIRYHGRGLIPIIGKKEYIKYSFKLQIPFCEKEDLVLDPLNAAKIFALFFKDNDFYSKAIEQNWLAIYDILAQRAHLNIESFKMYISLLGDKHE